MKAGDKKIKEVTERVKEKERGRERERELKLECSFCLGQREIGHGAILTGIPDQCGRVQQDELCRDCYLAIIEMKSIVPISMGNERKKKR